MLKNLQKRIRLSIWVVLAFLRQQKQILFLSTVIGISFFLVLKFFIPYAAELNIFRQKTRIGLVGTYTQDNLPTEILEKLSYGLVELRPDGKYLPKAAEDVSISEDLLVYTITLRDNLEWIDGKNTKSSQIDMDIEGAEANYPNKNQIQYKIKQPFSPFLSLLDKPIFKEDLLGFGDYRLRKIEYEQRNIKTISIYDDEKELTYHFYPNKERLLTGFRLGEFDQFSDTKSDLLNPDRDKIKIEEQTLTDSYLALFFNNKDLFLSEKNYRQALAYALKDKSMGNSRALTSIRPDNFTYSDKIKSYAYNTEKALDFLDGLDEKPMLTIATVSDYLPIAEKIKEEWQETLDFEINIELINYIASDYQILLLPQNPPLDPDQYLLWHSTQKTSNITNLASPRIDKLLEDGRAEHDLKKRAEIYQEFQKAMSEELPLIPLFYLKKYKYSRL